jgi:hypothetical protein
MVFGVSEGAAIAAFVVIVGCIIWLVHHGARRPNPALDQIAIPDWDY